MGTQVTSILTVTFGAESLASKDFATGLLSCKIDDRETGLNNGETSFNAGDAIGYLVYRSSGVSAIKHIPSLGTVLNVGSGVTEVDEFVNFVESDTATVSLPISNSFGFQWFGLNGGTITVKKERELVLDKEFSGVLRITYNSNFTEHKLTGIPVSVNGLSKFDVQVVLIGTLLEDSCILSGSLQTGGVKFFTPS